MIFKKSDNALLFSLIVCDFFTTYNRIGAFTQSDWNEHAADFQNKIYSKC